MHANRHRLAPCLAASLALFLAGCGVTIDSGTSRGPRGEALTQRVGDDLFAVGASVVVSEPVAGDAFLAGGDVSTAGEIAGDLAVAGGDVSIGGRIGADVYAAGGDVRLDAIVEGSARVAGGDVTVGPATVIAGGTSLTGGSVTFEGESRGYLQAGGGRVNLGGVVRGDAEVHADSLHIAPGTRIDGKLVYHGPERPQLPADAVIAGGVEYHEKALEGRWERAEDGARSVAGWIARLALLTGMFLAGAMYLGLFPAFAARAAEAIGRTPWPSLGLGFALLVCVPILAVVLMLTVVGIPLALLLLPLYLLLLLLGWINAGAFLGRKGLAALGRDGPGQPPFVRFVALLAGLAMLWLLSQLPWIGGLAAFAALLLGMGALVVELGRMRTRTLAH